MKKISILFVLTAFVLCILIIPAAAQTEYPPIDETEAAAFLGRWYLIDLCSEDSCSNMPSYGIIMTYDLNPDNTAVFDANIEDPDKDYWYMEDGIAYNLTDFGGGQYKTRTMTINEEDVLVVGDDDSYFTCTRNEPEPPALPKVIEAAPEDMAGEWHIKATVQEGWINTVPVFGDDIILMIGEETFVLNDSQALTEAAYIMENGRLYAVIEETDDEGQPLETDVLIDLRDDGSLFLTFDPEMEDENILVFTREKYVCSEEEFLEAFGLDGSGESGFSLRGLQEKLEKLQKNIDLSDLQEKLGGLQENLDLSGLIQQITGSEDTDLNALFQQLKGGEDFDINELFRKVTGREDLSINNLISGLTSNGGEEFDLNSLLEKLGANNSEGEGSFDLDGLLDGFLGNGQ